MSLNSIVIFIVWWWAVWTINDVRSSLKRIADALAKKEPLP